MKFAHFADVHIGSWRDPRLANVSTEAFIKAADACLEKNVDFILISGDFFNTSLPSIDCLKAVVKKLKEISDKGVPVYAIAGSHDFSPTGRTMLDVLENAGLLKNVMKGEVVDNKLKLRFTIDAKTGAKITGVAGRKGMLERKYFENLVKENLEAEDGFRIFMFHTAVSEFKPEGLEKMDSTPLSDFPKGFDYYAGGHVHEPYTKRQEGYGLIANPGPMFPNNFRELENLGCGGFYMVEQAGSELEVTSERVMIHNVFSISVDCSHKSAGDVQSEILEKVSDKEFNNTIVTMRLAGKLSVGKPLDIDFRQIFDKLYGKSAHFVMKNTSALTSSEFEEVKISTDSVEAAEDMIIREHLSKIKVEGLGTEAEFELTKQLMGALDKEKEEGETTTTFEKRIRDDVEKLLKAKL